MEIIDNYQNIPFLATFSIDWESLTQQTGSPSSLRLKINLYSNYRRTRDIADLKNNSAVYFDLFVLL